MGKTTIFYKAFYDVGAKLADKDRLAFYDALISRLFEDETKSKKVTPMADIALVALDPYFVRIQEQRERHAKLMKHQEISK